MNTINTWYHIFTTLKLYLFLIKMLCISNWFFPIDFYNELQRRKLYFCCILYLQLQFLVLKCRLNFSSIWILFLSECTNFWIVFTIRIKVYCVFVFNYKKTHIFTIIILFMYFFLVIYMFLKSFGAHKVFYFVIVFWRRPNIFG